MFRGLITFKNFMAACVHCWCLPSALFASGESYAGIYVPTLAWNIMTMENSINMKGFMVGNTAHMYTHTHLCDVVHFESAVYSHVGWQWLLWQQSRCVLK